MFRTIRSWKTSNQLQSSLHTISFCIFPRRFIRAAHLCVTFPITIWAYGVWTLFCNVTIDFIIPTVLRDLIPHRWYISVWSCTALLRIWKLCNVIWCSQNWSWSITSVAGNVETQFVIFTSLFGFLLFLSLKSHQQHMPHGESSSNNTRAGNTVELPLPSLK